MWKLSPCLVMRPVLKPVTISGDVTLNFTMGVSSSSLNEVVVTALGNVTSTQRSPVPVTIVTHDMMLQQASTNAVDAIASTCPALLKLPRARVFRSLK